MSKNIKLAIVTTSCLILGVLTFVFTSSKVAEYQDAYDNAEYLGMSAFSREVDAIQKSGKSLDKMTKDDFSTSTMWTESEEEYEKELKIWKASRLASICIFGGAFVFFGILSVRKQ